MVLTEKKTVTNIARSLFLDSEQCEKKGIH